MNLDTHIEDVVNLVRWEELSDVVLCGHSYGGCVISGVACRVPDRTGALVYLDAFVPENGEHLLQLVSETQRTMLIDGAKKAGEGWKIPPIPGEVFKVNSKDLDWMNRQCTMQPLACFEQPLVLGQGIHQIKNVTFILATGWDESPFPRSCERAKEKGWRTLSMGCGHDVMLDSPEELARVLAEVGRGTRTQG